MKSLYAETQSQSFESLFAVPGALFRDAPFWAWNCKLEQSMLDHQIDHFHKMGMGGFFMHSRVGLGTQYLGKEFMSCVKNCTEKAKQNRMLAWLYDEDRWPSGAAGGFVTREPKYRARHLEITFQPREGAPDPENDNSGLLLACYLIRLDDNGCLADYRRCEKDSSIPDGYRKIYVYRVINPFLSWFNGLTYVDTLNPEAMRRFIEITHEAYFREVGPDFGETVPGIFTDEPQFTKKTPLCFAAEERVVELPYTDDFPETYQKTYSADFWETVPELLWELPDGRRSAPRYRYHEHVAERFAGAFADTVGGWCEKHGLRLTGHMMDEPTLESQTSSLGEAMRSYRSFQLPGIDMLCDDQQLSTAKQAQSASHQFGRGGILCELDGVTDWDFPFMSHKGHGDWQAALGVTVRVPHLAWVSMAGEAKRDYPASISYQSPWSEKYTIITDHFSRVNTAMTRGQAHVRVAVVHPIESYWLLYGPQDQTASEREQAETDFSNLFDWLLHGLIDFDLLSESLLPDLKPVPDGKCLRVGEMRYDVIIVPPCLTLRSTTLEILERFQAVGGSVIFAGEAPSLCDALPSGRAMKLAAQCKRIAYSRAALLKTLEPYREYKVIRCDNGYPADHLLSQMRQDGDTRYLFLVNTLRYASAYAAKVMLRGNWQLDFLDTFTGSITPLKAVQQNGWTCFETDFYPHGHLLLRMTPAPESCGKALHRFPLELTEIERSILARVEGRELPVTLDEPNVFVLDQAQWRINAGAWQPLEEIMRLENLVRKELGLPSKRCDIVQPWVHPASDKVYGNVELCYTFECRAPARDLKIAIEQPERIQMMLDERPVIFRDNGFWTDEAVRTSPFPDLEAGKHTLCLTLPYLEDSNIEYVFLLGNFGVQLAADRAFITEPVQSLHWGDITAQGLPFYSGNITYHTAFRLPKETLAALRFPSRQHYISPELCGNQATRECAFTAFRGTLVNVVLDGRNAGDIAFSPFSLSLGKLKAGEHSMDLTLYGSRINSFGTLHLAGRIPWVGPDAWRHEGDDFTYDYTVQPLGIIRTPFIVEDKQ